MTMATDIRAQAARYYDLNPGAPDDIPFYKRLVPSPKARVLELGCGTGRVLVPLAAVCGYVHGIDLSEAMVGICREKLKKAGVGANKAQVGIGEITQFSLGRTFDLILAPYRVFQNLESELAVNGVFECVRQHLAPEGTCIFNVFNPKCDPDTLRRDWCTESETLSWEVPVEGGRVTCDDRRPRMDPTNLILYPELIYRRYEGEKLMDVPVCYGDRGV